MEAQVLIPAAGSFLSIALGAWSAKRGGHSWAITAAIVLMGLAVGLAIVLRRDPDVALADALAGGAIGGGLLVIVPLLGYFFAAGALSDRLEQLAGTVRPFVLGLLWLVSLVPLYIYVSLGGILTASLANCPPNAYECPF